MGVVHLARDTKLGRRVAIKFILTGSRHIAESFIREARTTAACQHPNIVIIHDVDEYNGVPYMVLEYLEGQSLRELMDGRRLSPERTVDLLVPVARALARAHELKIVHCDLKPDNIFIATNGTIKVLDFGIAAILAGSAAEPESGASVSDDSDGEGPGDTGTLPYLAPERFDGVVADPGVDIWALGIILYELLAGHHPVTPLTMMALTQSAVALAVPMPNLFDFAEIPHALATLVESCLQKDPKLRAKSAHEVLVALEALLPSRSRRQASDNDSPYPGLSAFQEAEADRFFGRGRDILQATARLREHPLGAIIGPSGIGKSSFVRAGIIPALKASGERWQGLVIRPGRQPLDSLATLVQSFMTSTGSLQAALADHGNITERLRKEPGYLGATLRQRAAERREKILIFVDQFEELYTLVPDPAERLAFTTCLLGVADDVQAPLRVLLSLRSDFLDRIGEDQRFADELQSSLILLQPLGRDALHEAINAPIAQLGYAFDTKETVDEMVQALATTAGALPLLQFAGSKLWDARDRQRKILTRESYQALGGISGVLAQHADDVVKALPVAAQRLVRALFQRLVTVEGTRAIVELNELSDLAKDAADMRALIDQLVEARLLVVQGRGLDESATVELVHESLITGWPLLRRWLDEGRDDVVFREQLRSAAKQWHARNQAQGLLWRGEAMEEARVWRLRHDSVLPAKEQEFLDAVFVLATRAERRRRAFVVGIIAALMLIIAGGSIALVQVRRAQRLADEHAIVANQEATRARAAEAVVTTQLDAIHREQEAKASAQAEAKQGKEDLRVVNGELQVALDKANAESALAKQAAGSLTTANGRLEKLLAEERARTEKLEKERKKISTELR